jgi:hypothetical protein
MAKNIWEPYNLGAEFEQHFLKKPDHKAFSPQDYIDIVTMLQHFGDKNIQELKLLLEDLKKFSQEVVMQKVRRIIRLQKILYSVNSNKK